MNMLWKGATKKYVSFFFLFLLINTYENTTLPVLREKKVCWYKKQ